MKKRWKKLTFHILILFTISLEINGFAYSAKVVKDGLEYLNLKENTSTFHSFNQVCTTKDKGLQTLSAQNFNTICMAMLATNYCKDIDKNDKVNCNDFEENEIDFASWYFISNCGSGLWKSLSEFAEFIKDILVWTYENFDSTKREQRFNKADKHYQSAINYVSIEFEKAMKIEGDELRAANAVFGNILTKSFQALGEIIKKEFVSLGCYNPKARSLKLCKAIGDIVIPPAIAFTALTKGVKAAKKVKEIALVKKVKNSKPIATVVTASAKLAKLAKSASTQVDKLAKSASTQVVKLVKLAKGVSTQIDKLKNNKKFSSKSDKKNKPKAKREKESKPKKQKNQGTIKEKEKIEKEISSEVEKIDNIDVIDDEIFKFYQKHFPDGINTNDKKGTVEKFIKRFTENKDKISSSINASHPTREEYSELFRIIKLVEKRERIKPPKQVKTPKLPTEKEPLKLEPPSKTNFPAKTKKSTTEIRIAKEVTQHTRPVASTKELVKATDELSFKVTPPHPTAKRSIIIRPAIIAALTAGNLIHESGNNDSTSNDSQGISTENLSQTYTININETIEVDKINFTAYLNPNLSPPPYEKVFSWKCEHRPSPDSYQSKCSDQNSAYRETISFPRDYCDYNLKVSFDYNGISVEEKTVTVKGKEIASNDADSKALKEACLQNQKQEENKPTYSIAINKIEETEEKSTLMAKLTPELTPPPAIEKKVFSWECKISSESEEENSDNQENATSDNEEENSDAESEKKTEKYKSKCENKTSGYGEDVSFIRDYCDYDLKVSFNYNNISVEEKTVTVKGKEIDEENEDELKLRDECNSKKKKDDDKDTDSELDNKSKNIPYSKGDINKALPFRAPLPPIRSSSGSFN